MAKQRGKGHGSLFQREPGGPWYAKWTAANGTRQRRSTGTWVKEGAARVLDKWITDEAQRKRGLFDPAAERYAAAARVPLCEHLDAWIESLQAAGVSAQQTATIGARARRVLLELLRYERLADIDAEAVQKARRRLADEGMALQTANHYGRACKQFARWAQKTKRIREHPLADLKALKFETDPRYERRPLEPEQAVRLVDAAAGRAPFRGLSGPGRAVLYQTALGTGFRAGELARLRVADLELDGPRPAVRLAARNAKNRKEAVQPVRHDLADVLRAWLHGKRADARAFPGTWHDRSAAMIRADLEAARIEAVDASGKVLDFHALRMTFITQLVRGGVSVKEAQALARHSTPVLTLNTYARLGVHDLTAALDALAPLTLPTPPERDALSATGTDHATPAHAESRSHSEDGCRAREGTGCPPRAVATGDSGPPRRENARPQRDSNPRRRLEKPVS